MSKNTEMYENTKTKMFFINYYNVAKYANILVNILVHNADNKMRKHRNFVVS